MWTDGSQVIERTHVNLVDLLTSQGPQEVRKFPSEIALSRYTKATKRIFPSNHLEAGSLLRTLLRQIMHPRADR